MKYSAYSVSSKKYSARPTAAGIRPYSAMGVTQVRYRPMQHRHAVYVPLVSVKTPRKALSGDAHRVAQAQSDMPVNVDLCVDVCTPGDDGAGSLSRLRLRMAFNGPIRRVIRFFSRSIHRMLGLLQRQYIK